MIVGIDGRPLAGATGMRGVGAYVRQLVAGLVGVAEEEARAGAGSALTLRVLLREQPALPLPLGAEARSVWAPPGPELLWSRLLGPRWLRRLGVELWHSTFLVPPRVPRGVRHVATIHDLIPLEHPAAFGARQRAVFRASLAAAARAERVVCVSETTAARVAARFGVPRERLRVVPPPVPDPLALPEETPRGARRLGRAKAPSEAEPLGEAPTSLSTADATPLDAGPSTAMRPARAALAEGTRFVLHLGGFDPLKGVEDRLLPAFAPLEGELLLVLVGDPGPRVGALRARIRELGLAGRVLPIGRITEGQKVWLLRRASALVVSSREEGFGIPAIEGLWAGLPVVVGEAEATREAVGEAGYLTRGEGPTAMTEALLAALGESEGLGRDEAELKALRTRRREHAARFAPEAVARRMLEVYRELVA